jgi:hypothetical protein
MANSDDFLKLVIKNVKFVYPKLDKTYRFNTAKKQSEACPPTAQGAAWSIGFEMPVAEATAIRAQVKAHYEACQPRNPKLPAFSKIFGAKKTEDGKGVIMVAKRSGTRSDGTANSAPKVVDGQKNDLDNLAIWSGSTGSVIVNAFPAVDPEGVGGISMILNAVQVVEAIYGGDTLDDFDTVAPPANSRSDLDDFGPSPVASAPPPAAVSKPLNEVLGDDIPFE